MRQEGFTARRKQEWERLEQALDLAERDETANRPQVGELPRLYRVACHHLALARRRAYGQVLVGRLHRVVTRAHRRLYTPRSNPFRGFARFAFAALPRAVRAHWAYVLVSALLFFGPLVSYLLAAQLHPEFVYTVLAPDEAARMESMYAPELKDRVGREREADSDFLMFGFYIRNNTGIGFQTFAGGFLAGLGTAFFLLLNGCVIGAVAGHLTAIGYGETFWTFVAGHSAPELTAIVLSGAAGLRLGAALLAPGRDSRARALRNAAADAVRIVYGAALLFLIAAFVEAFWSSIAWIAPLAKYLVGIAMWCAVLAWLALGGRADGA